jgi:hypothetical protein
VRGHAAGREQSHQPEHVVAVHVRDEDARYLADVQVAPEQLVLRALAAVEEPHLAALRGPQATHETLRARVGTPALVPRKVTRKLRFSTFHSTLYFSVATSFS